MRNKPIAGIRVSQKAQRCLQRQAYMAGSGKIEMRLQSGLGEIKNILLKKEH